MILYNNLIKLGHLFNVAKLDPKASDLLFNIFNISLLSLNNLL